MLTEISILSPNMQDPLHMILSKPYKSGINVKGVTGLTPMKANLVFDTYPYLSGSVYNSGTITDRTLVFTLAPMSPFVQKYRRKIYSYFPPRQKITIFFDTEDNIYWTEGYVESVETDIFSKSEELTVTVRCPYPYFYVSSSNSEALTVTESMSLLKIDPLFYFEFSNESTSENLIQFGQYENISSINFELKGDISEDYSFIFGFEKQTSKIEIKNGPVLFIAFESEHILKAAGVEDRKFFETGDIIEFSKFNNVYKAFFTSKEGKKINDLLPYFVFDPELFEITSGENHIDVTAYDEADSTQIDLVTLDFVYIPTYIGI